MWNISLPLLARKSSSKLEPSGFSAGPNTAMASVTSESTHSQEMSFMPTKHGAKNLTSTKTTMNTLQKIKAQRPWIEIIDDETDCSFGDNGFIVTLKKEYAFALDPDCSVRGFDTISELKSGTSKSAVRLK